MTCTEEYKEHIEYTFHAFVKLLSAMPATQRCGHGAGNTKEKYPLTTSQMKSTILLGTTDEYFKAPEPDEEYIVHLCGDTVILSNGLLVQALSRLPAQKQEMLYLSFLSVCRSMKSADGTDAAAVQWATISEKPYSSFTRKWRDWRMRNNELLPMTQSYRLPAASRKRSTPYCSIMGGEYAMLPVSADKLTRKPRTSSRKRC